MVTKANRSKAAERIEKAKQAYNLAESQTDGFLARLIDSKYTLAIVVAVAAGVLWMVFG